MKGLVIGLIVGIIILIFSYAITQIAPVRGQQTASPPTVNKVPARLP